MQSNLNYKILLIPLKERDKVVSVSLPRWASLRWLKANKLSLNVAKTEFMVIKSRQKLQSLTGYTMNIHIDSVPINQSNQSKSLWLIIDENLLWKTHIHPLISLACVSSTTHNVQHVFCPKGIV